MPISPSNDESKHFGSIGNTEFFPIPTDGHAQKLSPTEIEKTVRLQGTQNATTDDGQSDARRESILKSTNIGQTIHPRDLGEEERTQWLDSANISHLPEIPKSPQETSGFQQSLADSRLRIPDRRLAQLNDSDDSSADYRVLRLLGRGGMGDVYVANQTSLDRKIAVKVIRPLPVERREKLERSGRLEEVENERRHQFLSEAVITGDLAHPNIVPIHDVALADDGTLFYSMKRVEGLPWSKSLADRTLDENVEILLRVADAIAFAHTRGIIHRDIKPENVMLGDFGEVLMMDWGLALPDVDYPKLDALSPMLGLGGTPAFMAPEMAVGPLDAIGPWSDIYLLGATLYCIITGEPPHQADNVSKCIRAVATNKIEPPAPEHQGELMDIALEAMADHPDNRFDSVKQFQEAIRAYRSHAESISIASTAQQQYELAIQTSQYESFSRASHGFEQAIQLWPENTVAVDGLVHCRIDHAQASLTNGDYELGLSLLDPDIEQHRPLIERLEQEWEARRIRGTRLTLFRRLAAGCLAFILIGGGIAIHLIEQKRFEAEKQTKIAKAKTIQVEQQKNEIQRQKREVEQQRSRAVTQAQIAEKKKQEATDSARREMKQRRIAETKTKEAERNLLAAIRQRAIADQNRLAALAAKSEAEYEFYVSQIGLAKAKIEENEFDDARRILTELRRNRISGWPPWEWRWLHEQANQHHSSLHLNTEVVDLAIDRIGSSVYAACQDGSLHRISVVESQMVTSQPRWTRGDLGVTSVAINEAGTKLAVGTELGDVLLLDVDSGELLYPIRAHQQRVSDVAFFDDARVLSSSFDRTVAMWNLANRQRLDRVYHIAPVRQFTHFRDQRRSEESVLIAVASDHRGGRVVGWRIKEDQLAPLGEMDAHQAPVISVALAPDGMTAASADSAGRVAIWDVQSLKPTDVKKAIGRALNQIDEAQTGKSAQTLISTRMGKHRSSPTWQAHSDAIAALQFSSDGKRLITASDDYTIGIWDSEQRSLLNSLRGHGGWVQTIDIVKGSDGHLDKVISGSADGSLRSWNPNRERNHELFVGKTASTPSVATGNSSLRINRRVTAHADEILSARLDRTGTRIITASRDHTARILGIDRETVAFRELVEIHPESEIEGELAEGTEFLAMSAQIDLKHRRLFVGSADAVIRTWDLDTGVQLDELIRTGLNISFALSANGKRLISGSSDQDVDAIVWDIDPQRRTSRPVQRISGHSTAVTAMAISRDGALAITGDRSGTCFLWNVSSGQPIGQPITIFRGFRINDIAIAPDGRSVWIASDNHKLVQISLSDRRILRELSHDGLVTSVSLSDDARFVTTVSQDLGNNSFRSSAILWDLERGKRRLLQQFDSQPTEGQPADSNHDQITSAEISSVDNSVLIGRKLAGGRTGRITVVDFHGKVVDQFGLPDPIGPPELAIPINAARMITLNGEAAFLWDLDREVHEKSFRPHASVSAAEFSHDGRIAATASRSLRFWDSDSGAPLDKLESPHHSVINDVSFAGSSHQQRYLIATAGNDGFARLWSWSDTGSGCRLEQEFSLGQESVSCVRFFPSELRFLCGGAQGTIQIWNAVTPGAPLVLHTPGRQSVLCADISNDGRWFVVGSSDKRAYLFDTTAPESSPIVFRGHADQVESVALLQDATGVLRIFTASRDKTARVWDPCLSRDRPIPLDDPATKADRQGREIIALRRHTRGVTAIDCSDNGAVVITAGRDGRVVLWPARE